MVKEQKTADGRLDLQGRGSVVHLELLVQVVAAISLKQVFIVLARLLFPCLELCKIWVLHKPLIVKSVWVINRELTKVERCQKKDFHVPQVNVSSWMLLFQQARKLTLQNGNLVRPKLCPSLLLQLPNVAEHLLPRNVDGVHVLVNLVVVWVLALLEHYQGLQVLFEENEPLNQPGIGHCLVFGRCICRWCGQKVEACQNGVVLGIPRGNQMIY